MKAFCDTTAGEPGFVVAGADTDLLNKLFLEMFIVTKLN